MKKVITTTTINPPTDAIKQYDNMDGWELIVVGDRKTPDYRLERGRYVTWKEQQDKYPDLCGLIGPDSVRRGRMIAFIEAHRAGADIVASIDDDNYPLHGWGKEVLVGKRVTAAYFKTNALCLDPLHTIGLDEWHRGFPVDIVYVRPLLSKEVQHITPLVQADLWTGDGDVDATVRLAKRPDFGYRTYARFTTNAFSPVNTQNTFILGKYLKDFYANIPFIGRMDDIWAGYLFEAMHPGSVLYGHQTVLCSQDRTAQSIINDLKEELFGYKNTYDFLQALRDDGVDKAMQNFLPPMAIEAIEMYKSYFK